mmetsp:Transcript_38421/g.70976  ORF Transcript_38421/g.70976 Transcript_38421/m.70976 type:complete len:103 (-) Transcript_38421:31-339(-)
MDTHILADVVNNLATTLEGYGLNRILPKGSINCDNMRVKGNQQTAIVVEMAAFGADEKSKKLPEASETSPSSVVHSYMLERQQMVLETQFLGSFPLPLALSP